MPKLSYKRYEKLRDEAGMTNTEVAKKIGIPQPIMSSWKTGRRIPKVDKIILIAKLFNKPVDYFYVDENEKEHEQE